MLLEFEVRIELKAISSMLTLAVYVLCTRSKINAGNDMGFIR